MDEFIGCTYEIQFRTKLGNYRLAIIDSAGEELNTDICCYTWAPEWLRPAIKTKPDDIYGLLL